MRIVQMLDEGRVACANIDILKHPFAGWPGERGEGEETGVLIRFNAALLEPEYSRHVLRLRCTAP
jgi:hypothetical protein